MGPLQQNLSIGEGAELICYALEKGVNFLDTAESYRTYPYIKEALRSTLIRPVICSKSYAYTWDGMKESVEKARDEMGLKTIDIFMLHEQESELTLKGHGAALEYLVQAKKAGLIKAIGLSTHAVAGVMAAAENPDLEVIHPLINQAGIGIIDGTAQTMAAAISYARVRGRGLYGMKVFGGGNLIGQAHTALDFALSLGALSALAIGMKSRHEIDLNMNWMEGKRDPGLENQVSRIPRRLHIESWCTGCGRCADFCRYEAISINNEKAEVEESKCILCGYCAGYCTEFCIKVI